jgi:small-conductance mechanosensitive channel
MPFDLESQPDFVRQATAFLTRQKLKRAATRTREIRAADILTFGIALILLMNIVGTGMSALVVLAVAIGVGLGFGLQTIASNFISGAILPLQGQWTVGDHVELDGGEAGKTVKITARFAILETFHGRRIVVPNGGFMTTRRIVERKGDLPVFAS